jgi:hypothetical protein
MLKDIVCALIILEIIYYRSFSLMPLMSFNEILFRDVTFDDRGWAVRDFSHRPIPCDSMQDGMG